MEGRGLWGRQEGEHRITTQREGIRRKAGCSGGEGGGTGDPVGEGEEVLRENHGVGQGWEECELEVGAGRGKQVAEGGFRTVY